MRRLYSSWRDGKRRWRQHFDRRREFRFVRRLHGELLEDRHLLAVITVYTLIDEADGSIDDGDVSLRDAIAVAADGDTIDFDVALDGGTILLTLGELPITRSMTIDAFSLWSGLTIDASDNDPTPDEDNGDGSRILNIDDGDRVRDSEVTLSGLTLTGGDVDGEGGGIQVNYSDLRVTDSTISGNSTGTFGGGIYTNYGNVTVTDSTITGNTAVFRGGGIVSRSGGALRMMTINSSTITGNSADAGGGIYAYRDTILNNSIVAGNSDLDVARGLPTSVTATNSLIGNNTGSGLSEAPVGMPDENGNLVGDPNGTGIIDPLLSPLGNFGGSTQTHALLPGSPAINAGDPELAAPPDRNQRGPPFDRVAGGRIEMGAFESQIAPVEFNNDDQLDCVDVDALVAAIVEGNNPPEFDLTGDALVDQADLHVWLSLAGLENLPSHDA